MLSRKADLDSSSVAFSTPLSTLSVVEVGESSTDMMAELWRADTAEEERTAALRNRKRRKMEGGKGSLPRHEILVPTTHGVVQPRNTPHLGEQAPPCFVTSKTQGVFISTSPEGPTDAIKLLAHKYFVYLAAH